MTISTKRADGDDQVGVLATLERYYDTVPRARASALECGPFTVFVAAQGWPYYARPRLGLESAVGVDDVRRVLARMRELGVPRNIEWVAQTTPSLRPAAVSAGMRVDDNPLLVLDRLRVDHGVPAGSVAVLRPEDPRLPGVRSAISAGFDGTDTLSPTVVPEHVTSAIRAGLLTVVGAFDAAGEPVGGGSHSPREGVTELTGIAVLPRHRRQGWGAAITAELARDAHGRGAGTIFLSAGSDEVARVYERVGFRRVGTACVAEAPD